MTEGFCVASTGKNDCYLKDNQLKKKILEADKDFFKYLDEVREELHMKSLFLHVKKNLLFFNQTKMTKN